jgi:hypothetical protein
MEDGTVLTPVAPALPVKHVRVALCQNVALGAIVWFSVLRPGSTSRLKPL